MTSKGVTDVNYVSVDEHKKLSVVDRSDRFSENYTGKLNKYMVIDVLQKYIDVLQDIIYIYIHRYNRGIKRNHQKYKNKILIY